MNAQAYHVGVAPTGQDISTRGPVHVKPVYWSLTQSKIIGRNIFEVEIIKRPVLPDLRWSAIRLQMLI